MKLYKRNCNLCGLFYKKRGAKRFCSRKCFFNSRKILKFHPQWRTKQAIAKIGNKNPQWQGNKVKYDALHAWVRRNKPKPNLCECCQKKSPYDLANISQKYKRDIDDFEWLCRTCHMTKDGRLVQARINMSKCNNF